MPGYGGTYRGVVVDTSDPSAENRVKVHVPEVSGADGLWAQPHDAGAPLPGVGDEVTIQFENSDEQYPIWSPPGAHHQAVSLDGVHRATVLNNLDPEGLGRLYVTVPDVTDGMWASPEQAPPAVGEDVWVQFPGGSTEHATWSR